MRIEGFSYSKGESSRVVSEDLFNQDKESLKTVDVPGIGAKSTDYTKGAPYKSTRIIFILSGGSKREKDYFRPLKTDEQIHSVKVAFRSKEGQGLKPYELKELAEDFAENRRFEMEDGSSFHIVDDDIIYLLQDVDEFSEELIGYLKDNDISTTYRWVISNPSFEIWLFYHYFDKPTILQHGIGLSERDRSNWLKEYLNTLIPGGVKTTQSIYDVEPAIENSKNNYTEHEGFPLLYSTQMHIVADSIISIMKEEFDRMKKRRAQIIEYYRNINKQKD